MNYVNKRYVTVDEGEVVSDLADSFLSVTS